MRCEELADGFRPTTVHLLRSFEELWPVLTVEERLLALLFFFQKCNDWSYSTFIYNKLFSFQLLKESSGILQSLFNVAGVIGVGALVLRWLESNEKWIEEQTGYNLGLSEANKTPETKTKELVESLANKLDEQNSDLRKMIQNGERYSFIWILFWYFVEFSGSLDLGGGGFW